MLCREMNWRGLLEWPSHQSELYSDPSFAFSRNHSPQWSYCELPKQFTADTQSRAPKKPLEPLAKRDLIWIKSVPYRLRSLDMAPPTGGTVQGEHKTYRRWTVREEMSHWGRTWGFIVRPNFLAILLPVCGCDETCQPSTFPDCCHVFPTVASNISSRNVN